MTVRIAIVLLGALAGMGGCASPAQRISVVLQDYGMPPRNAQCIGDYLQDRLSVGQLLALDRATKRAHIQDAGRPRRFEDLVNLGLQLDPGTQQAIAEAGVNCTIAAVLG